MHHHHHHINNSNNNNKQLFDEVFVIIPDITKTESNNCFITLYLQVISQFVVGR